MINELLWVGLSLISFVFLLICYRLFGKIGLYAWTTFAIVLANIQVLKTIQLFGIVATLGNIIYGTIFFVTDILSELYGKKESKKAVYLGLFATFASMVLMYICINFIPHSSDFANESLTTIFTIVPRIAIGSIIAYFISSMHDIYAYEFWKKKTKGKHLWLRNNLSTMVSQLIDTIIFSTIAFLGMFPFDIFLQIMLSTYIFKWLTAALDTPFIYVAKAMKKRYNIK